MLRLLNRASLTPFNPHSAIFLERAFRALRLITVMGPHLVKSGFARTTHAQIISLSLTGFAAQRRALIYLPGGPAPHLTNGFAPY